MLCVVSFVCMFCFVLKNCFITLISTLEFPPKLNEKSSQKHGGNLVLEIVKSDLF